MTIICRLICNDTDQLLGFLFESCLCAEADYSCCCCCCRRPCWYAAISPSQSVRPSINEPVEPRQTGADQWPRALLETYRGANWLTEEAAIWLVDEYKQQVEASRALLWPVITSVWGHRGKWNQSRSGNLSHCTSRARLKSFKAIIFRSFCSETKFLFQSGQIISCGSCSTEDVALHLFHHYSNTLKLRALQVRQRMKKPGTWTLRVTLCVESSVYFLFAALTVRCTLCSDNKGTIFYSNENILEHLSTTAGPITSTLTDTTLFNNSAWWTESLPCFTQIC